jgi:hypothetical protein
MRSPKQGLDQIGLYDDGAILDTLTVSHIAGVFPSVFIPKWGRGAEIKQFWSGVIGLTGYSVPFVGRLDTAFTSRGIQVQERASQETDECGEWIAAGFRKRVWSGPGLLELHSES